MVETKLVVEHREHLWNLLIQASQGARGRADGQRARIRLLRGLCSTSASPSTSSTGGT